MGCLDNAFDLVNRMWRYSGNQIHTVVFMICLKKELLRAYASSSSISVPCVITLWQRSNDWQGQSSMQDKFCSKQHNLYYKRIFVEYDVLQKVRWHLTFKQYWFKTKFPSLQPCSRGDPTAGFGICAINHIYVWYEDLRTCCLNVFSLGGSLTKAESLTVSNFTRNLFRSIWHRFDFPFGSYSLDISFRLRSTESFYSGQITKLIGWLFQSFEHKSSSRYQRTKKWYHTQLEHDQLARSHTQRSSMTCIARVQGYNVYIP
jgi:hypothetical protein